MCTCTMMFLNYEIKIKNKPIALCVVVTFNVHESDVYAWKTTLKHIPCVNKLVDTAWIRISHQAVICHPFETRRRSFHVSGRWRQLGLTEGNVLCLGRVGLHFFCDQTVTFRTFAALSRTSWSRANSLFADQHLACFVLFYLSFETVSSSVFFVRIYILASTQTR